MFYENFVNVKKKKKRNKKHELYSLSIDVRPSCSDKVPCQRLTNHVACNVDNGGCGILLSDEVRIKGILQIPKKAEHAQAGNCKLWAAK